MLKNNIGRESNDRNLLVEDQLGSLRVRLNVDIV
jgi:hypothetical protein